MGERDYTPDLSLDGHTAKKMVALKMIGMIVDCLSPMDLASMYRDDHNLTMQKIARICLGNPFVKKYPKIAETAVQIVLKQQILPLEHDLLVKAHRERYEQMRQRNGYYQSENYRQFCSTAATAKHTKMSLVQRQAMIEDLVRTHGQIPWGDKEKEAVKSLTGDPLFSHKKGSIVGLPNFAMIAGALNAEFGNNRTSISVRRMNQRLRNKERCLHFMGK